MYTLQRTPGSFDTFYISTYGAGGQVVGVREDVGPVSFAAALWTPPTGAYRELGPLYPGLPLELGSFAFATDGVRQVGVGYGSSQAGPGEVDHAVLWSGTAVSAVDLNPAQLGFSFSHALGIFGTQQVGAASLSANSVGLINSHAVLWNGTAASAVDLHPINLAGITSSTAQGTDEIHQVGYGSTSTGPNHALFWSGTAASAVDLHPTNLAGFDFSEALGVSGQQQVGYGGGSGTGGKNHALLWTGTAASAVDLHPTSFSGFDTSTALGTNGVNQVGYVSNSVTQVQDAVLWSGTAASAIDLSLLLPFASTNSTAYTIDTQGNVWGTATDSTGAIHAVEWSTVPEPAAAALVSIGALGILVVCRRLNREFGVPVIGRPLVEGNGLDLEHGSRHQCP